ncbi:DUF3997 domain-containing protein [Chryseobacterium soli]|nr:DUF3997 domain-containing protein [Chryseobacterium soli]
MKTRNTKLFLFFLGIVLLLLMIGLLLSPRVLFPFGYGPGIHDFTKGLTGRYNLYRNSAHTIFVAPEDGWNDEDAIIPSKVIKVNTYSEFIIAERQGLKKRNPKDSLDGYEIPDPDVIDYWILNTNKNYVLKNLDNDDFKKKLDSLKVPVNIKLIDVYEY